jgi:hypothetical protein
LCGQQPRAYDSRNSCGPAKAVEQTRTIEAPFEAAVDFDFDSIFDTCSYDADFFGFGDSFAI